MNLKLSKAKRFEKIGNYDLAIEIYKELGEANEVSRIKKLMGKQKPKKTASKSAKKTASKKSKSSGKDDPPIDSGFRTICYIISFLVPIVGIVIGLIYNGKEESWHKEFGMTCLKIAVASILLGFVLGMGMAISIIALS